MNKGQTQKTKKIERFVTKAIITQYTETLKLTAYAKAYGGCGRVLKATVTYRRSCRLYKCKYRGLQ